MNGKFPKTTQDIIKENLRLQCISIFIEAYKISISGKIKDYENEWDEDQFTAYLFQYIEEQQFVLDNQWVVTPQTPYYTKEISSGKMHASKARKPDIRFSKYHPSFRMPFSFYIEAKNLSENDWQKKAVVKWKLLNKEQDTLIQELSISRKLFTRMAALPDMSCKAIPKTL